MSEKYTVIHKKSSVVNNGVPKLPSASTLEYGEIAINYGVSGETLSIKNSNDQIVTFSSDSKRDAVVDEVLGDIDRIDSAITQIVETMEENDTVVSTALGNLDDRLDDVENAGYITGFTESDPTVPAWAKESNKPQYTASEVGAMATSERGNYLTTATTIPSVGNYFDDAEYDSNTKRINLKHGDTVKKYIDATDFIKDGMVDDVEIATPTGGTNSGVTCLVVTFNTDSGKEDIEIPLSQIFNANNYYTKTEADGKFITGYTETDPTVPAWAKAANKPSYTAEEVGAMAVSERSNYSTTAHTHDQYSLTSHTHSQYATTAHTHTAEEVGAMTASERGNYLTTATTIPTETSIEASGFTKNALTAYTETDPTVPAWAKAETKPSYTASEVGAMATNERGNYLTTATTIPTEASIEASGFTKNALTGYTETDPTVPAWAKAESKPSYTAAEVGAMATSERSNYSTTGHTHSQYSLTSHTHTAAEVGAMATSERNNYLTTATTIPTESSISGSGFTKNAITGINVNGTAATITNGVAEINVQSGGGSTLPSVTTADNGKVLMVVDGAWAVVMPTTVYTGTDTPLSSIGNDGDIYLQTS